MGRPNPEPALANGASTGPRWRPVMCRTLWEGGVCESKRAGRIGRHLGVGSPHPDSSPVHRISSVREVQTPAAFTCIKHNRVGKRGGQP